MVPWDGTHYIRCKMELTIKGTIPRVPPFPYDSLLDLELHAALNRQEIKMTSRRVNALEYVLIPRIEDIIHYITQVPEMSGSVFWGTLQDLHWNVL